VRVKAPEPEPEPQPARTPLVIDPEQERPHIVDGMLVHPDGRVTDWDGAG
jgi:hypothetical protein